VLARLPTVFRCLNDRRVRAVVIGGVAAIVHGVPRTTFDQRRRPFARPGNAGVPPAPPRLEGVRQKFTPTDARRDRLRGSPNHPRPTPTAVRALRVDRGRLARPA
jgi:hypothetical protein